MTLVLLFLKSYWKQVAGAIALATCLYLGYYKIYDIGYAAANVECAARIKQFEEGLDKRIANIENTSGLILDQTTAANITRKKDFVDILASIKNKPLYTIEQGKCKPSTDFIDAYNKGIEEANTP
jgi:uncharacterized protein (UPF0276 family)